MKTNYAKKLKPSEVICPQCNGTGSTDNNKNDNIINCFHCENCHGYGVLDWIEAVVGKRSPVLIWGQTTLKARNRKLEAGWTIETSEDLTALYSEDLINEIKSG